jgi:hypothetical protein
MAEVGIYSLLLKITDCIGKLKQYTSIIYMEDDTRLSWPALISWALDTEVLEPLNFTRCILRTEVDQPTGYLSNCMVPLIYIEGKVEGGKSRARLAPIAEVEHMAQMDVQTAFKDPV